MSFSVFRLDKLSEFETKTKESEENSGEFENVLEGKVFGCLILSSVLCLQVDWLVMVALSSFSVWI